MAITTIMAAIGTSEESRTDALVDAITDLAVPTGAQVVLAHVFDSTEFQSLRDDLDETGSGVDLSADELARRRGSIRAIQRQLTEAGVDSTIRGNVGDDRAQAIVALATDVGADRLLVGGRRRSPAGKAVFGSTAQEVLLNAPCPVEFVRSN